MANVEEQYALSQDQIDFFVENGYIKLSNCFTKEQADDIQSTLWTRLGMDPNDMSTWNSERIHMPHFREFDVSTFSPRAWAGMCSLLGGASRIKGALTWKDGFIVNLGTPQGHNKVVKPQKLYNWHVDGDFFVHYLDSPEQGLLVIPLWSDIVEGGGGTMICPKAIEPVARLLEKEREGVSPRMTPRRENPEMKPEQGLDWFNQIAKNMPDEAFVEATGVVGDVYLLHPLMLHSASNNQHRKVRVITNPPVSVREPFSFDREDGNYSAVERKTLRALGKDRLEGWKIEGKREMIVPERMKIQEEMKKKEAERLQKLKESRGIPNEAQQVRSVA
ncbi:hypothetical protein P153DRAFT_324352 [Dothidotthia symphoricarpi CBS 119687]|uniref:Uncharacterized protein n=1 Tax=Dothidotthia symphoricarpi CBS 119687 TaxID=1392245 RepID=A0A6A6A445_9PLEO|nr:uncharacterized protein P153DRAFT_324352 [Dothidotthia symphoricarpi CBS 119687]KAF2125945.1 hypothetical protein P153DRAFT_324352 [Dothidotthia symphoricarpi CBS 119687]